MLGLGLLLHFPHLTALLAPASSLHDAPPAAIKTERSIEWQPFSPERLQASLADGRAVLVLLHADWDISSQYAKHHLASDAARELLLAKQFVALDADSTDDYPPEFDTFRKSIDQHPRGSPRHRRLSRSQ